MLSIYILPILLGAFMTADAQYANPHVYPAGRPCDSRMDIPRSLNSNQANAYLT